MVHSLRCHSNIVIHKCKESSYICRKLKFVMIHYWFLFSQWFNKVFMILLELSQYTEKCMKVSSIYNYNSVITIINLPVFFYLSATRFGACKSGLWLSNVGPLKKRLSAQELPENLNFLVNSAKNHEMRPVSIYLLLLSLLKGLW